MTVLIIDDSILFDRLFHFDERNSECLLDGRCVIWALVADVFAAAGRSGFRRADRTR